MRRRYNILSQKITRFNKDARKLYFAGLVLSPRHSLGLAVEFNLPVIIVARPDLGTINHTLLTIDSLRRAGLALVGVIINGYDESKADLAVRTAPTVIAECGDVKILAVVPFDETTDIEKGAIGQQAEQALSDFNWSNII